MTAGQENAPARRWADALAVYLRPRVLIVMFLGFSSGLPLALSGSTLQVWATEGGVDLRTIGLFAIIGTPYTIKFLWAPLVDALDLPLLSRPLGRRRGWLVFSQLLLMLAIVVLAACDPKSGPALSIVAAILVATASATQDIVIDAFRVESLPENEQAAGMAAYVAAYRVALLISTAGALYIVTGFETGLGFARDTAWTLGYVAMALLVAIGLIAAILATEPAKSAEVEAEHARHPSESKLTRVVATARTALADFLLQDMAVVILAFVVLFKFTDALAGAMTAPFVIQLGFSRVDYANVIKGLGFAATLLGGFAGGYVARAFPLATSLWIGGILQAAANFAFSWQAHVGKDIAWLSFAITMENFTSAIGTVIFVGYLSALCRNPLHTATQFALLTALSAVGRTYLSAGAGFVAAATGWGWFFAICAFAGIPGLLLLAWLQARGHFAQLEKPAAVPAES
ncbi:MAG: transporter, family, beta-lactamase induction signal transducer AmpG [Hyphomicrobiales bacterium]|jgi:PAT family beta-lactamase induction signal transducer AmpG